MALIVGSATVATGMSPVVEGALYADEIFIDGMTYTSKFDVSDAGQIQVEKYEPGTPVTPKTPGSNFVSEEYKNTVVVINTNNSFQKSTKVPAYYQATMPADVLANKTWDTTEAVRVGRQMSGLAVLIDEGLASDSEDALTSTNIKAQIIADRSYLRKLHAHPNVVICSVDTYSKILEAAGKDFTPGINDEVVRMGRVGYWLGMLFLESSALSQEAKLTYLDEKGTAVTVDSEGVDYIMYDYAAFSIIDRLNMLRVIDSEEFAGSKVQEELDVGYAVTNKDCVMIKSHTVTPADDGGDDDEGGGDEGDQT